MNNPSKFASLFPLFPDAELQKLAAEIKTNGLRRRIVLHAGEILDGRNRYAACKIAGVEPEFEDYSGDDPLGFVLSENLHRRHLTNNERAMIAAKIANMKSGTRTDLGSIEPGPKVRSIDDVARELKVSLSTVKRAKSVLRNGAPELAQAVRDEKLSLGSASAVASLPVEEQTALLAKGPEAVKEKAAQLPGKSKPAPAAEFCAAAETDADAGAAQAAPPESAERIWLEVKARLDDMRDGDVHFNEVISQAVAYCAKRLLDSKKPEAARKRDRTARIVGYAKTQLNCFAVNEPSLERAMLDMISYCVKRMEADRARPKQHPAKTGSSHQPANRRR